MKLISLNAWGNKAGNDKVNRFYKNHSEIDIFCLQEVWHGGDDFAEQLPTAALPKKAEPRQFTEIQESMSGYTLFFHPQHHTWFGLVMSIKNDYEVVKCDDVFVHETKDFFPEDNFAKLARNIQYVTFNTTNGKRTIVNFHGLWNGKGKGDSSARLSQSDKIIAFLKTLDHPFVLAGDFNLLPETQSMKKFEVFGLRNLIVEYDITSTRTSFYNKPIKFADYIFVSDGIKVSDFKVLPDLVSDHAPLYLEFE